VGLLSTANQVDEQSDRIVADAFGISALVVVAAPSSEYAMTQRTIAASSEPR
jgi:hypothetical protein